MVSAEHKNEHEHYGAVEVARRHHHESGCLQEHPTQSFQFPSLAMSVITSRDLGYYDGSLLSQKSRFPSQQSFSDEFMTKNESS
jgi:hypothetical protein